MPEEFNDPIEIRDKRCKEMFFVDNKFLNGYAKRVGVVGVAVYASLCRHADREQKSWPGMVKIGEELNISRFSVIRALARLEEHNIIKRIRLGRGRTNRYLLKSKNSWQIPKSDVRYSNIKKCATATSRSALQQLLSNNTQLNNTQSKYVDGEVNVDFSFKNYLEKMAVDTNRHIQIIALYWKHKKIVLDNHDQVKTFINRELRPARTLVGFSDEQIIRTMDHLDHNVDYLNKWTLETVFKYIGEVKDRPKSGKFISVDERVKKEDKDGKH